MNENNKINFTFNPSYHIPNNIFGVYNSLSGNILIYLDNIYDNIIRATKRAIEDNLINDKYTKSLKAFADRLEYIIIRTIVNVVNHEVMHRVLYESEGHYACNKWDKIAYGLEEWLNG